MKTKSTIYNVVEWKQLVEKEKGSIDLYDIRGLSRGLRQNSERYSREEKLMEDDLIKYINKIKLFLLKLKVCSRKKIVNAKLLNIKKNKVRNEK